MAGTDRSTGVLTGVVSGLLAVLVLLGGPAVPAAAAVPGRVPDVPGAGTPDDRVASGRADYPTLPSDCATREEVIPQHPVVCEVSDFRADRPTVLLWGDSHAWMLLPALQRAVRHHDVNLVLSVMGACPPLYTGVAAGTPAPACFQSNRMALDLVRSVRDAGQRVEVVLSASWARYLQTLEDGGDPYTTEMAEEMRTATPALMQQLGEMRVSTTVVAPVATVPERRRGCAAGDEPFGCDLARSRALPERGRLATWLEEVSRPLPGHRPLLDVNGAFCDWVCHGLSGLRWTWFDDLHLSASTSATLWRYFRPVVRRAER